MRQPTAIPSTSLIVGVSPGASTKRRYPSRPTLQQPARRSALGHGAPEGVLRLRPIRLTGEADGCPPTPRHRVWVITIPTRPIDLRRFQDHVRPVLPPIAVSIDTCGRPHLIAQTVADACTELEQPVFRLGPRQASSFGVGRGTPKWCRLAICSAVLRILDVALESSKLPGFTRQ